MRTLLMILRCVDTRNQNHHNGTGIRQYQRFQTLYEISINGAYPSAPNAQMSLTLPALHGTIEGKDGTEGTSLLHTI